MNVYTARINPENGNAEILRGNKVVVSSYTQPCIVRTRKGIYITFSHYFEGVIPKNKIGKLFVLMELKESAGE